MGRRVGVAVQTCRISERDTAEREKGGDRPRQQVEADAGEPVAGRQVQHDQRREARPEQPGEIVGEGRAGVAVALLEPRRHRAGRLPVGQAEQREAGIDVDRLADRVLLDDEGRDGAGRWRTRRSGPAESRRSMRRPIWSAIRPEATIAPAQMKAPEHCTIRNSPAERSREQADPADREHGHEVEQREARQRDQRADEEFGRMVPDQGDDRRGFEPPLFEQGARTRRWRRAAAARTRPPR